MGDQFHDSISSLRIFKNQTVFLAVKIKKKKISKLLKVLQSNSFNYNKNTLTIYYIHQLNIKYFVALRKNNDIFIATTSQMMFINKDINMRWENLGR